MCERPGCHLPAIYCEQHAPEARQVPPIRAVIEDVIRELEWDGAVRWAAVIQSLRDVL